MTLTFSGIFLFTIIPIITPAIRKDANLDSLFTRSNAKFATDFYSAVTENNTALENFVISPFAVQTCGTLVYLGASGQTATDMAQGLRLNQESNSAVGKSFRNALKHHNDEFLKISNKIFLGKNTKVKNAFRKLIKNIFLSEEENVDFLNSEEAAETINNWVSNATHNKIKHLFTADDFDAKTNALMALVNTIYFKGVWTIPFEATKQRVFWTSDVESKDQDMLCQLDYYKYGDFPQLDSKVLQLEYNGTDVSMLIILPNNRTGLQELEAKLPEINLIDLQGRLEETNVEVILPKFRIESSADLKTVFAKLGMSSLFVDPDLSKMLEGEKIKVDKAIHKAFIEVTEVGTEAGASTAFSFHFLSRPELFVADHPFIFAIVSKSAVLFVGRYVN